MAEVVDPFGAAADPGLPILARALDPDVAEREFKRGLPRLATARGIVKLKAIRVLRHKPGRRCVIEYDVRVERPGAPRAKATLIGKVRARRFGNESYRLLRAIWEAGFNAQSRDHISVPEPIGVIPGLRMWLQRKAPGIEASSLLSGPDGVSLGRRIAEALHKLHQSSIPTRRRHTMLDELRILHEHLPLVRRTKPKLGARIARLLVASDRLGASVPSLRPCGIHRDFYPAQVLVHKQRLFLLDFDLYCLGDPALDAGNFLGHVIESSLRRSGNPQAFADRERALEDRFVELTDPSARPAVQAYTTLTLVRHIYLSTQFPERTPFTEALLDLCEQRLAKFL